jgi:hypothetical protein
MFSDIFYLVNKYSVIRQEYISTIEVMPRRFTSLVSDQYLPVLSEEYKNKLNGYFNFTFPTRGKPIYEFDKDLWIEYSGDTVIGYDAKCPLVYHDISKPSIWNRFVRLSQCPELNVCKEKIDKITSITDINKTRIFSISYDDEMNLTGVKLYDSAYDLGNFYNNETLSDVNTFVQTNKTKMNAFVEISPNIDKISYFIDFAFTLSETKDANGFVSLVDVTPSLVDAYLSVMKRDTNQIITSEQADYIKSKCIGNSAFDLELIINDSGEIEDIILHHVKIANFRDLTLE